VANLLERLTEMAREGRKRDRSTAAEWAAGVLRDWIIEGLLKPGTRVSEDMVTESLEISRNTAREAFRLLAHEKLLEHRINRGVFVRLQDVHEVHDLFTLRRVIECAAIRQGAPEGALALDAAVTEGERAAKEDRWVDVGTANIRFHQAIGGLLDSPRVDELMRQVLAELRLVFHQMGDPRAFHEGYLPRNREIVGRLAAGDAAGAETLLRKYFDDAEQQLIDAFAVTGTRTTAATNPPPPAR